MNLSISSHLAVGERVHRIDDDGAGALRLAGGAGAHRGVNDRDEEAERLAGTGPGRDDEALPGRGLCHRLGLMAVER